MMRLSKQWKILGALVAAATVIGLVPGAPAQAVGWNTINGETYSNATKWYVSDTLRYLETPSGVAIKFSTMPRFSNGATDGIKWQLLKTNGSALSDVSFMYSLNKTYTLLNGGGPSALYFKNKFARTSTCTSNCGHTFQGSEWY